MAKKEEESKTPSWLKDYNNNYLFNNYFQKSNPENYVKVLLENLWNKDLDVTNLFDRLPKSNTISRRQSTKNINEAHKNEKLVLVLGAGISLEFGVPSWNLLLQTLMVHTIEKENNVSTVLSKLFNGIFRPNPLIAGRYLQDYFEKNDSSFESMVRNVCIQK